MTSATSNTGYLYYRVLTLAGAGHDVLSRPRVNQLLAQAIEFPVVTVVAGGGYGKTRAVLEFLHGFDAIRFWVQLTERDNIGSRFWENITHTIALYNRAVADQLIAEGFPQTAAEYEKYTRICMEGARFDVRRVLVFDDFHLLNDPAVLTFFERSVISPFPNCTLVLISRREPAINLARLALKGQVANITESQLRFSEDEIAVYLRGLGVTASADSVAAISADTEGWAFAVNLVCAALRKNLPHEAYARAAMKLNIFKLLESEVFNVVSERLQHFLLRLSLIEHLAIDLIEELAEDPALLEELDTLSAYVRYDTHINTYLIHHLFFDYLRERQERLSAEEKRETWLIAARWCQKNDYKIDAVTYYEKAGEYLPIAEIVYGMSPQIPSVTARYLLRIFDDAPVEAVRDIVIFAVMHMRLFLSLQRFDDVLRIAKQKVKELEASPVTAFTDRVISGMYLAMGYAHLLSRQIVDDCDFDEYFRMADVYYSRHPYEVGSATASANVGMSISLASSAEKGALDEYVELLSRAVPHMAHTMNGNMAGADELARGELYFYRAKLDMAEKFVIQALRTTQENNQFDVYNRAVFYLMRIGFAQGNYAKVEQAREALKLQLAASDYLNRHISYDIVMGWYYLMLDQPQLISEWIKSDFEQGTLANFLETFANQVRAKYYYINKRYHELLAFLETWADPTRPLFGRIEMKLQEAVTLYQIKEQAQALQALRGAYEMSEANGIDMPFIVLGQNMRTLTAHALRDGAALPAPRDWLERINRKAATYAKRYSMVLAADRKARKISEARTLSARESDVLADLYQGLSRSEIAASRDLSINTVKAVINHIYNKLGADNIADVVRIAAEKDLIR